MSAGGEIIIDYIIIGGGLAFSPIVPNLPVKSVAD
jgi:hypothetical protein